MWLEKLLPPKIQQTDPTERRTVPEGLWIKCPSCETVLYKTDLEQNLNVCPKCDHHHRIGARAPGWTPSSTPKAATRSARRSCRSTR
jgi:acetyl-CoA carboxylase carboxyl transferase subunit beta